MNNNISYDLLEAFMWYQLIKATDKYVNDFFYCKYKFIEKLINK